MSRIVDFARDELGLKLYPRQAAALAEFEAGGYQQAVWRWGRRGGKSLSADVLALYDAIVRDELRAKMLPGETRTVGIVCPRLDQAAAHIRRMAGWVERSPRLRRLLASPPTTDTISFRNGSEVVAYPCSARGIRGGAWSCAILDELGHFITTADGNAAGDLMLEAVGPSLAQFGRDGWLVAISTPRWKQGAFWTLSQRAGSGRFDYMHALHLATAEANPAIDPGWLEDRRREDPDVFAREYLAEWIDGAGSYLSSAEVVAAVRAAPRIAPPQEGVRYVGALDPAYSLDRFAMAIAHRDADGRIVVDGVWAWHRPGHDEVMDAVAELARAYRVRTLRTDQHAPVPIREALLKRGQQADYQPWTNESKASAFAALKVALNTRSIELPDDAGLIEELCNLEARPTPAGFTRIAAAGQGHDDRAVAVAACAHVLSPRTRNALVYVREEVARAAARGPRRLVADSVPGAADRAQQPPQPKRPVEEAGCRHQTTVTVGGFVRCRGCDAEWPAGEAAPVMVAAGPGEPWQSLMGREVL